MAKDPVDIAEVIDRAVIGRAQIAVFTLCALCLIIDGFDVQALGYGAPAIIQAWGIQSALLGPVFAAGNFGVLIGQLFFAMLADRIGRRPVLIAGAVFFAIVTLLTAHVTTVNELLIARLVAGIGLGSILPNATALAGEYSPRRLRVAVMSFMGVGFTAGALIGGFIAAVLIPALGWQSIFYFGGAVPVVIAMGMLLWLPESLQFLVVRDRPASLIARGVHRVDPHATVDESTTYIVNEEQRRGMPVMHLFRGGRAACTLLLWVVNFMNLLNLYFLSNWLPTLVRGSGYATSTAILVGTMLQLGGTLGTFLLTWLIAKKGFFPVLIPCFLVGSLSVALIGKTGLALAGLVVVVIIAGATIVGSQPTVNALSGTYYPTYLRSTGIGWGLGIGRAGAIVGPGLGGLFLAWHWSTQDIMRAAAIPALVSALAMIGLRIAMKPRSEIAQQALSENDA